MGVCSCRLGWRGLPKVMGRHHSCPSNLKNTTPTVNLRLSHSPSQTHSSHLV